MIALRKRWTPSFPVVLVGLLGLTSVRCQVFDTRGSESTPGRGPTSFDPYVGARSAAVRLGLQFFDGCAIYATGEPVGRGNSPVPYPDSCQRHPSQEPVPASATPQPMPLLTNTDYFL